MGNLRIAVSIGLLICQKTAARRRTGTDRREHAGPDTRTLYKIDLGRALESRNTKDALISVVKLTGALKGSFTEFDGKDLWVIL